MYECKICGKECKTIQGLLSHKRLKHGIVKKKAAVIDYVPQEEYFEDPREKLLLREQAALMDEIAELKAEVLESMAAPHDIKAIREELQNRRAESEEKISEENLTLPLPLSPPPLPPLPPPPFMETLTDKIKRLNDRTLFR